MNASLKVLALGLLVSVPGAGAEPLHGAWKGKIHRQVIFQTQYHQAVYAEDLDLTIRAGADGISGQGTAHLSDPLITRTRPDPRYAQWTAAYLAPDVTLAIRGSVNGQEGKTVFRITLTPASPVPMRFHYRDGTGASTEARLALPSLLPQSIPVNNPAIGRFSLRRSTARGDDLTLPPDLAYFGESVRGAEYQSDGHFEKIETPPRKMSPAAMLAALLAYLTLVLPLLVRRPDSSGFLAMLGALLGSLKRLQNLGLVWTTANHVRCACLAAAALIGALELSRRHKANSGRRSERLVIAAILDLSAFAACAVIASDAIDYSALSAAHLGPFGAAIVAITTAAVVTHAVAAGIKAVKALTL